MITISLKGHKCFIFIGKLKLHFILRKLSFSKLIIRCSTRSTLWSFALNILRRFISSFGISYIPLPPQGNNHSVPRIFLRHLATFQPINCCHVRNFTISSSIFPLFILSFSKLENSKKNCPITSFSDFDGYALQTFVLPR